jgi:glucokinase
MFVVVDLGGTKILSLVVDSSLTILAEDRRPTDPNAGPGRVVQHVAASIRAALGQVEGLGDVDAIGIAAAGTANREAGTADSVNLPHWRGMPIVPPLRQEFGCDVVLENDGNAAAWGEFVLGAGRGSRQLVYLSLGTGVGGGLVLAGRLYRGAGGAAGELGHIPLDPAGPTCGCGSAGCLEQLASGTAIARRGTNLAASGRSPMLSRLAAGGPVTAVLVHRAASDGDVAALEIIQTAGVWLGRGLIALINIFNPDRVVLGGGLTKIGPALIEPALAEVGARAMRPAGDEVEIRLSELGDRAAPLGLASKLVERTQRSIRQRHSLNR